MSAEQTPDIERVLAEHTLHASMNICTCGNWRATPGAGALHDQHRAHVAQALAPVLAAAVREAKAEGWDECAQEVHDLGWLHDFARSDAIARNPYRADRVAEPQHEAATSGPESEASDE